MSGQTRSTTPQITTTATAGAALHLLSAPWRMPEVVVARHALASYFRSGWMWGESLVVLALYVVALRPFAVRSDNFFGIATLGLGVLAFVGTILLVRRSMRVRAYLSLARLPSRAAYLRGVALAGGVLRVLLYLVLLLLELLSQGLLDPSLRGIVVGSFGLLLDTLILSALAVVLTPPVTTRVAWIVFLAWLVGALTSYTSAPIASWLTPLQLPLQPFIGCFTLATTGSLTWSSAWAPVLAVVYIVGLIAFAQARFARRDLLLR